MCDSLNYSVISKLYLELKFTLILSISSMIIGSLGALKQTDLKRLMAYSTINHVGFILMALVPGSEEGITAICT